MKAAIVKSKSARKMVTNNNSENTASDGWEGFDDDVDVDVDDENDASTDVDGNIDFEKIESSAQLAVDLRKALSACEQLTEQLTKSETERDEVNWHFWESLISSCVVPIDAVNIHFGLVQLRKDLWGSLLRQKQNVKIRFHLTKTKMQVYSVNR